MKLPDLAIALACFSVGWGLHLATDNNDSDEQVLTERAQTRNDRNWKSVGGGSEFVNEIVVRVQAESREWTALQEGELPSTHAEHLESRWADLAELRKHAEELKQKALSYANEPNLRGLIQEVLSNDSLGGIEPMLVALYQREGEVALQWISQRPDVSNFFGQNEVIFALMSLPELADQWSRSRGSLGESLQSVLCEIGALQLEITEFDQLLADQSVGEQKRFLMYDWFVSSHTPIKIDEVGRWLMEDVPKKQRDIIFEQHCDLGGYYQFGSDLKGGAFPVNPGMFAGINLKWSAGLYHYLSGRELANGSREAKFMEKHAAKNGQIGGLAPDLPLQVASPETVLMQKVQTYLRGENSPDFELLVAGRDLSLNELQHHLREKFPELPENYEEASVKRAFETIAPEQARRLADHELSDMFWFQPIAGNDSALEALSFHEPSEGSIDNQMKEWMQIAPKQARGAMLAVPSGREILERIEDESE